MVRDPESAGKLLPADALTSLRREWAVVASIGALSLWAGYVALRSIWDASHALTWLLLSTAVLIYELMFLWHRLDKNHPSGQTVLFPTLGPGNRLSLLRALLMAGMAGFLFSPWPQGWLAWLPGILYTAAAIVDAFDGAVARRAGVVTELGAALDLEYDALGILVAPLLAVWYGQLPPWFLIVSLSRYLFVAGLWSRKRRGLAVRDLTRSGLRRQMASLTMAATAVALWPLLPAPVLRIVATGFMLPFLAGFFRDWLVASARIDPESARYRRAIDASTTLTARWLPLLARLSLITAAIALLPDFISQFQLLHGVLLAAMLLILIGFAGRSAAVVLSFFSGVMVRLGAPLDWPLILALLTGVAVMLFGAGPLSLWKPEDRLWGWPPPAKS